MPDDTKPEHANSPSQPAPASAPSLTDAEANRQLGQGGAPHAANAPESAQEPLAGTEQPAPETAPEGSQTVKVGARDIVRPTGGLDESEGAASGGDTVYDRLAKKDNTDAGPGGQSGAA